MSFALLAIQPDIRPTPAENLEQLGTLLERYREREADIVALPEMFVCPYQTDNFPRFAEPEGGPTWQALSAYARQYGIYLAAGTVPEVGEDGKVYNTAYVFDRNGNQIAKHRKIHLFDIQLKEGTWFRESDTVSAGNQITVFNTEFGTMGVCVCYDIRFPELFRRMVDAGAKLVFVPASFNMKTGPSHWDLCYRSRAVDNQIYVIGCAPARNPELGYVSYSHSIAADPWGEIAELGDRPGVLEVHPDFDYVDKIRQQLPLLQHRRKDLYEVTEPPQQNS